MEDQQPQDPNASTTESQDLNTEANTPVTKTEEPRTNFFDSTTQYDYQESEVRHSMNQMKDAMDHISNSIGDKPNAQANLNKGLLMYKMALGSIPEKIKSKLIMWVAVVLYFITLGIISCISYAVQFPKVNSYLSILVLSYTAYTLLRNPTIKFINKIIENFTNNKK